MFFLSQKAVPYWNPPVVAAKPLSPRTLETASVGAIANVGDFATHRLGAGRRSNRRFARSRLRSKPENLSEFLDKAVTATESAAVIRVSGAEESVDLSPTEIANPIE